MINVKYEVPAKTPATLADGTAVEVGWNLVDGFSLRWGQQRFLGSSVSAVLRKVNEHRAQDRASAARARAVRASKPLPALTFPDFEEVGVRGRHAQSGYALITLGDGTSGTPVPFSQLLRPLDEGELAKIRAAHEESVRVAKALTDKPPLKVWDASEALDAEVVVRYDDKRELFVATTDSGDEAAATSASFAVAQAQDLLFRKRWPFALVNGDGDPRIVTGAEYAGDEQYGRDGLFTTQDEASEYLSLLRADRAAADRVLDLLDEYAFDSTLFRTESD